MQILQFDFSIQHTSDMKTKITFRLAMGFIFLNFYSKAKDVVAKTHNHPSCWEISSKVPDNLLPPQTTYPPPGTTSCTPHASSCAPSAHPSTFPKANL